MIKAVELFAGIGGFRLACDELSIKTVWANDNSAKAATVYRDKFGTDVFVEGDIAKLLQDMPDHDLLTAGFPCQPFSSAGKKLGLEDPRGTLFEKIVMAIENNRPELFVLENVKRLLSMDKGKHFATILHSLSNLGYLVEWRLLNAANFGLPQHRERVVIVGHRQNSPKSFLCTAEDLSELSARQLSTAFNIQGWPEIEDHGAKFANWGIALRGRFYHATLAAFSCKQEPATVRDVLEDSPPEKYFFNEDTRKRIAVSEKVDRYFNGVEILYNQRGGARMGYTVFGASGVAPTLTCTTSRHYERYKIGDDYRRLTPVEYARIQGFPDDHCASATPYDQYPLYGNAVPPAMVKWVIERITTNGSVEFDKAVGQMELLNA